MMDDTYLYVRQARPDLYEEIVAFSSVVELTDEITTRAAIEKFCMHLVDACKYALIIIIVLLSCGVAEAKEVIIEYQDFIKMIALKEHADKMNAKLAAENAVLVKLKDEQGAVISLQQEDIRACREIVKTHEQLGETEAQISKAVEAELLRAKAELAREKRLSRYKSEAFAVGIIAAVIWGMRR